VIVRTLHHYDALGLIKPAARSAVGYRLYSMNDLERLQQVMFYKELAFDLDRIRKLLSDPAVDRRQALRLDAMLELIDRALRSLKEGTAMKPDEMFAVFGEFDPSEYESEVRERWGHTAAYRESARCTRDYTKKDWEHIRDENAARRRLRSRRRLDRRGGNGHRRGSETSDRPRLLSLLAYDAHRTRRDLRQRCAVPIVL
jgi:DNA-binding transcriptional MerR regulator